MTAMAGLKLSPGVPSPHVPPAGFTITVGSYGQDQARDQDWDQDQDQDKDQHQDQDQHQHQDQDQDQDQDQEGFEPRVTLM